jgi:quercetin dioxygenase-like cupin family protein
MRRSLHALLVLGALCCAGVDAARAQEQVLVSPQDLRWRPAPPAFPPGSEVAALYGDPAKEGPFALRARAPKGFRLPPHTHPAAEIVTVLSGAIRTGLGKDVDPAKERRVPAGGFVATPPGLPHWLTIEEDAIVQVNGVGPWGIDYLDPHDDPRKNEAPAK